MAIDAALQSKIDQANAILAAGNYPNNAMRVSADFAQKNPDFTPQQLANQTVTGYWSNESEAYSRVINAVNNNPEKIKFIPYGEGFEITTGEHPGYDTLYLKPTSQPGVYEFSTYNQKAGGNIHGVIGADPTTGKVVPVVNAAQQFAYTPGSSGSFFGNLIGSVGDTFKSLGPLGVVLGNLALPGLGTGLGIAAAIDEGNVEGALKSLAIGQGLSGLGVSDALTQATGSEAVGQLGTGTLGGLAAGQDLTTALTNAAIGAGVNQAAAGLANQTPADFESDINQVLDLPATQTPDIFVDTTAPELPSGMDLSSDIGPTANTVEDVSQALAGEGTAVSGQDLAADATPGNTLQDVSTALTPAVTPVEEKPGLNKEQIASLLKTGLGLFGGITAASKALSSVPPINSILNTQSVVNAPTPFTGTYSGMNMTNPEYFQQVQQNYNRLFPNTPADVATPLQAWYSTEYKPETPVIKSLFGL